MSKTKFKGLDKSVRLQRIIDTAAILFHKKGYHSTTIDDVARELGLTKAALYHYVARKEELLSIIYTQAFETIFKDTNNISKMDLSPDEKLRRIIINHITNIIIKGLSMFSVFFSEETQLTPKAFRKIRAEKVKYTDIIEKIIAQGISQGLFCNVDPKLQAYAILGMCNWVYKWYKPGHSPYNPDQIANHFVNLLERGYMARDTKDSFIGVDKKSYQKLNGQCRDLSKTLDQIMMMRP